jgi:lysophospholipase L1-like esterase
LLTPVARRRFTPDGAQQDGHGDYPNLTRAVAKELEVPLLDMHRASMELLAQYGAEKSQQLFLILPAGAHVNYPQGVNDNTHFSTHGALEMATLAARALQASPMELGKLVRLGAPR